MIDECELTRYQSMRDYGGEPLGWRNALLTEERNPLACHSESNRFFQYVDFLMDDPCRPPAPRPSLSGWCE